MVASVPDDVLYKASGWLDRTDILCQRAVSPGGRDLAQRAIARKAVDAVACRQFAGVYLGNDSEPMELQISPLAVEAIGRVFAPGCERLWAAGTSARSSAALCSFVASTGGGLLELHLSQSSVSSDALVEMCRAAPNLTELWGPRAPISDEAIVAIAAACPRLEVVEFSSLGSDLSPVERWQRYFPRLKRLTFAPGRRHTLLENICEAARNTRATELDLEGCHIFADEIGAIVGTPVGDRLTSISTQESGDHSTNIEPEALMAAARGFPRLTELWIPQGTIIPNAAWYADLARIRTFPEIDISSSQATDAHVIAVCRHNPLETLRLEWLDDGPFSGRGLVDGLISSQSAATLRELEITYCGSMEFGPVDLLRLVRACASLTTISWQHDNDDQFPDDWVDSEEDGASPSEIAMCEILAARGGKYEHHIT